MNEISEYELIMLYHEKNEIAEEILIHRYEQIIKYILNNYDLIIEKLGIEKEDLYGDSLATLKIALDTYIPSNDASFRSYVNILVNRKIQKIIKRHVADKRIILSKTEPIDNENVNIIDKKISDPLKEIIKNENIEEINNFIINNFSKQERDIFLLLYYGLTYKEICLVLDMRYKQIVSTVDRIRKKLDKYREF